MNRADRNRDDRLHDKISKIEALHARAGTDGEQQAAKAALERIRATAEAEAPVRITATVLNIDRNETFYDVSYLDLEGKSLTKRIPRELFRQPTKVVDILTKAYADLPDDSAAAVALVKDALQAKSEAKHRVTGRSGWRDPATFVYPTKTFGKLAGQLIFESSNDIDPALGKQLGTVSAWREGLREPCNYSDFIVLTVGAIAATPLLDIIAEDEGAIFHLHGTTRNKSHDSEERTQSSSGKTLAARAAASMIGRSKKNDMVTFAASERSVEDYCFAHNDLGGVFDEEGRALSAGTGPRIKSDQLPYLVPSGRGGLRSKKATRDRDLENLTWVLNAVSTGEHPLDDRKSRPERPEGAQVRMISTPVPSGKKGGIFNRVKGSQAQIAEKSKKLARQVEETIAANFGVAMPAYLQEVVAKRSNLSRRLLPLVDQFVKHVGADTDPWERRFAGKFGIVQAAAILMCEFGIAPWTEKRARKAITAVYKNARSASASVDEATDALVQRLRKIAAAGERFPVVQKGDQLSAKKTAKAWGVIRDMPKLGRVLNIRHSRIERFVTPSAITGQVLRELARRKVLVKASDGKLTRELMIKALTGSTRRRYVCISVKALRA
jgi:hypothetical protein